MRVLYAIFFGNYFYGLCTVALSIEASLQQQFPLNPWLYYLAVFAATVLYYTLAYISDNPADVNNKRSVWYAEHHSFIKRSLWVLAAICLWIAGSFVYNNWQSLLSLSVSTCFFILIFPATGALYYGLSGKGRGRYNLRRIGWLKPFIIGFTWAGVVTIYPIIFYQVQKGLAYEPTLVGAFLFLKNFMFITVLCIMFDIKDYAVDHNLQIKTFVVTKGLRYTIFYILLPLCFLGLGSFVVYGLTRHFHPIRIALNIIPFILLILVAYSMHQRKPLLYYLAIIDGLMLVKAICGSAGMAFQ